jgi:hypothetical protein
VIHTISIFGSLHNQLDFIAMMIFHIRELSGMFRQSMASSFYHQ